MEHLKFDSFGANGASEAAVVAVDVQLEQLVVLCSEIRTGNRLGVKGAGLHPINLLRALISVWPTAILLRRVFQPGQGVSLCHSSCHPPLTGTDPKLQENQTTVS